MRSPFRIFALRIGWEFTNTLLLVASFIAFFFLAGTPAVHTFLAGVGQEGYLGAFLAGLFFASTFTVAPALVVLYALAHALPTMPLALVAGFGAMLGDFMLFRFVRDRLTPEWQPVFTRLAGSEFGRVFASPFFASLVPVIGAIFIATPLPDEVGVSILGLSQLESWKILLLTLALNVLGIAAIVFLAQA